MRRSSTRQGRHNRFPGRGRGNFGFEKGSSQSPVSERRNYGFERGRGSFPSPVSERRNYGFERGRGSFPRKSSECNETLQTITSDNANINNLLRNGDLLNLLNGSVPLSRDQIFSLMSSIIQFSNEENSPKSIKDVYILVLNSNFVPTFLEPLIKQYFINTPPSNEFSIVVLFIDKCLEYLPNQFLEKMGLLYPCLFFACEQFPDREIKSICLTLKNRFEITKKNAETTKLSLVQLKTSSTDSRNFREYSVIPQDTDIFCLNSEVPLRPNKVSIDNIEISKYESVDDYLDTQFCLLKEDFVRPLREGIARIREDLLTKNKMETKKLQIRFYENVIVGDMYTSRNGLVHKVTFDTTKFGKIDWKKARRFIYGSLLCFTNNFFETIFFANVIESDPKNLEKGIVIVQFNTDPINEVLENNEFMMIETKNLFEAYRHVLSKLQTFSETTLPLRQYIVSGGNIPQFPAYMTNRDLALIDAEAAKDIEFDESQRIAFVGALKSSLSLVQGPPGTGKTYVGLKIIKHLFSYFPNLGPILVVCYTNHALDQFLFDIINAIGIENVLRVGGRSKMEVMKECNMSSIKFKWKRKRAFAHSLYRRGVQIRQEIEMAEHNLIAKYAKVKNYDKKLLSKQDLENCFSLRELLYFKERNFDLWIKGCDSIIDNSLAEVSNLKRDLIKEQSNICIDDVVHRGLMTILNELFQQNNIVPEDDIYDAFVENPDDVLFNHNFIDDDVELLMNGNRFQRIYEDNDVNGDDIVTDEEGFRSVANVKLIKNKLKRVKPLSEEEHSNIESLDVAFDFRLRLYKYWQEKYRILLLAEYRTEKSKYETVNAEREAINSEESIVIMRSMKVIGMTTTGAARYGTVLDRVGCQVVVIEEAAEVMEAHVVCSLSDQCEHLIMIGDHKQLRPKVDVYDLEINYNLAISLFERLIANKCPYSTLAYQHRMRPEISVCMKPIYPNLQDSDVVRHYPSVAGMRKDIYFFDHKSLENSSIETSYKNDFEAEFVANLCEYLIKCGNMATSITVLTLYAGQLFNISKLMRKEMFKGIRICVIDNFQGEENEIIVLSMVRSNIDDVIGFVSSENRLCVTLSRAKRGFYVVGNFSMICRKIKLLKTIINVHLDKKCFGNKLPLTCLMHPDENNYFVSNIEDFKKKGCPAQCDLELKCGHICTWPCHRDAPSHKAFKCGMQCEKMCTRGLHHCPLLCHKRCACDEMIEIDLPCGHKKEIVCRQTEMRCTELCEKVLTCSHQCKRMCFEECLCEVNVECVLDCGHVKTVVCGTDVTQVKCINPCGKQIDCGHVCNKKCFEKCVCTNLVEYTLQCDHKHELLCGTDLATTKCSEDVERTFPCGHCVTYKCFKDIKKCPVEVTKELRCGHESKLGCGDSLEEKICERICGMKLNCMHKCKGKCGECYNQLLHVPCRGKCRKFLKCKHYCDNVCHSGFCPPCPKQCAKYCAHSQCKSVCGQSCDCQICDLDCLKKVVCCGCRKNEKCLNKCGVACSKLCKLCLIKAGRDGDLFYVMEPCNCYILKTDFRPIIKKDGKEISLLCQDCERYLRSPYDNVVLMFYKREYLLLFEQTTKDDLGKWTALIMEFKRIEILPENFEKIIDKISSEKICKEDANIFDVSFKYYRKLLDLFKLLLNIKGQGRIEEYHTNIKIGLLHLSKWLNPFIRNFADSEIVLWKFEKFKLRLSLEILSLLSKITVTDYALVHKQLFEILDKIPKVDDRENLEKFLLKAEDIKRHLNNTKNSTKDEEEFIDKIINAKNVLQEFGIDHLSVEEKIKEIKNLIRRCHPDKNKSPRANEAVKRLLEIKKHLEPIS